MPSESTMQRHQFMSTCRRLQDVLLYPTSLPFPGSFS